LFTVSGRHELAGRALAHPVRTVLAVYAVSRLVALLALWVAAAWFQNPAGAGHEQPGVGDVLGFWDSTWYERIVQHGYPATLPVDADTGEITYSAWAFYPLFPLLLRPVVAIGLPFTVAAGLVNLVLGAIAALLIWAVLRFAEHADPQPARARLALVAACLWCFYPATPVMLKAYTEPLAMVLIAGLLLLLLRKHYWWAAVVAVPLGFTRGVAPAVGLVALAHLLLRWREDRAAGREPLAGSRLSAVVVLGTLAVSAVSWPAYVGWATGRPTAFFDVQAAWGQRPSEGPFVQWLTWAWESKGVAGVVVLVALVGTYLALILGRHGRWMPVEVRVYALAYPLYLFAVVRPITSMWRFLLLDFPLAALIASVAMRTSTGAQVVPHWRRRVALVLLAVIGGILWWTAVLLVYTPWASNPP
jgi:hypothetical protein